MKQVYKCFLFVAVLMTALCSCEKMVVENMAEPDSRLTIKTRAGEDAGVISYPLKVFIFKDSRCVALETLAGSDDELNLLLSEGTYNVYAIGGLSEESYDVPAQADATPESVLALKEAQKHGDLMAARNTVTLNSGEGTQLVVSMERKVAQINTVSIRQVPAEATAVRVSFAPVYQAMSINGEYTGAAASYAIALERQEDGTTWRNAVPEYMLPSVDKATINIAITTDAETRNYSYTCGEKLTANYIFNITGTYEGASGGIRLKGSFTGATWADTKTITFSFSDTNGASDEDPSEGTIPNKGDFYKGCYVLAVKDKTETSAKVTLLSPVEKSGVVNDGETVDDALAKVNAELSTWSVTAVTGWRLPTEAEKNSIIPSREAINTALGERGQTLLNTSGRYFYSYSGYAALCKMNSTSYMNMEYTADDILRPVTTITVTIGE